MNLEGGPHLPPPSPSPGGLFCDLSAEAPAHRWQGLEAVLRMGCSQPADAPWSPFGRTSTIGLPSCEVGREPWISSPAGSVLERVPIDRAF